MTSSRARWNTAFADVVAIVVFAAIGRQSHAEALTVTGVAETAWPFVVGAAVGWALIYLASHVGSDPEHPDTARQTPNFRPHIAINGVAIWFSAVAIGMAMRWLTHAGIAVPFIIVASIVLALFLIGWRVIAQIVVRRSERTHSA